VSPIDTVAITFVRPKVIATVMLAQQCFYAQVIGEQSVHFKLARHREPKAAVH